MDSKKKETDENAPLICHSADQYHQQNERYQMFVEQAPYGFFEIDIEGLFTFFNNAFCNVFDRTREELENHKFTEFMTPDHGQEVLSRLSQIHAANKPVKIFTAGI